MGHGSVHGDGPADARGGNQERLICVAATRSLRSGARESAPLRRLRVAAKRCRLVVQIAVVDAGVEAAAAAAEHRRAGALVLADAAAGPAAARRAVAADRA